MYPCSEYHGGLPVLGNNNGIHSTIMLGETLELWIAAGWDEECENPLYSPFVGFDLQRMLDGESRDIVLSSYDPPWNDSYGNGVMEQD